MTGITLAIAVIGAFWTPYDATAMSASLKFAPPSFAHWFGTDNFGRDILSRVMEGVETTVVIRVLVVAASALVGVLVGALTGYFGGLIDEITIYRCCKRIPKYSAGIGDFKCFRRWRRKIDSGVIHCVLPKLYPYRKK